VGAVPKVPPTVIVGNAGTVSGEVGTVEVLLPFNGKERLGLLFSDEVFVFDKRTIPKTILLDSITS
jgi:hypothetical protein